MPVLTILRLRDNAGAGLRGMSFAELEMRGLVPLLTNYNAFFTREISYAEIGAVMSGRHEWVTCGAIKVSDILVVYGEAGPRFYYRDTDGLIQLEFETEIINVAIKDGDILILVVPPGGKPYPSSIKGSMDAMREIVGGEADVEILDDDAMFVLNKDLRTSEAPVNRTVNGSAVAGTFFICGLDGGRNPCSLTEAQLIEYLIRFNLS